MMMVETSIYSATTVHRSWVGWWRAVEFWKESSQSETTQCVSRRARAGINKLAASTIVSVRSIAENAMKTNKFFLMAFQFSSFSAAFWLPTSRRVCLSDRKQNNAVRSFAYLQFKKSIPKQTSAILHGRFKRRFCSGKNVDWMTVFDLLKYVEFFYNFFIKPTSHETL